MTWVKIDDAAPLHPKLLSAGAEAAWLWLAGLAHCNRATTDGIINKDHLTALYPVKNWSESKLFRLAKRLVEVGLWVDDGSHFRVHDYEDYQEEAMRAAREDRRAFEREKKRKQRAAKRHAEKSGTSLPCPQGTGGGHVPGTREGHVPGTCEGQSQGTGAGHVPELSPASVQACPRPPSRPVPSRPVQLNEGERTALGQIDDEVELEAFQVEQLGTPRFKQLGGKDAAALNNLCPIRGWEYRAAMARPVKYWGGFIKVMLEIREERSKPKPPAARKKPPTRVQLDDDLTERQRLSATVDRLANGG